jgi:hypothetical protein
MAAKQKLLFSQYDKNQGDSNAQAFVAGYGYYEGR